jgi:hypothetical protein
MLVVEDARPGVVGVEDNWALVVAVVASIAVADVVVAAVVEIEVAAIVVAVVAPITVADVDVVVVVAAAVIKAFVVAVVRGLAAVQLATGRLEHSHWEGLVAQSCGFRWE